MRKKILLIGGGGHCASVADALLNTRKYSEIGIIDPGDIQPLFGKIYKLGTDDDLPELYAAGWTSAFVTLGSIGDTSVRRKVFQKILEVGFECPNIIDPSAAVSEHVSFSRGIFVGKNSVINAGVKVGDCAIINTSAVVEHDCNIGAFVHVSPNATLCGGVCIGENTHVGAGAVLKQYITVGADSLIGMGSVVIHDIGDQMKVFGNPARVFAKTGGGDRLL